MSRRTIAEVFPRFSSIAPDTAIEWHAEWSANDPRIVVGLAGFAVGVQDASRGADELISISNALRLDLGDLLETAVEEEIATVDCFRFLICLAPMRATVALGRLRECYDWSAVSVSRTHNPDARSNVELVNFPPGRSPLLPIVMSRLDEWAHVFFMVASKFGGLDELGTMCLKSSWLAAMGLYEVKDDKYMPAAALSAILSWTAERDLPELEDFTRDSLGLWNRTDLPGRARALLGIAFTTKAFRFSGKAAAEWATLLLAEYRDFLVEHEPLQLLSITIRSPEEWQVKRAEVLAQIAQMAQQAREFADKMGASEIATFEGKVRILHPLIMFLAEHCDVTDVIEVLAAWYRRPQAAEADVGSLFVCPTNEQVIYSWPGGHWTSSRRVGALESLFVSMSAALGDYYRGPSGDRLLNLDEKRAGSPVANEGWAFEQAMLDYFLPRELKVRFPSDLILRSIVLFPSLPVPIQAMLRHEAEISAPLESSFSAPAADWPVRNVSVWLGATIYTDFELEVLEAASRLRDWRLRTTTPPSHGILSAFRRFYEDADADVLWVIGHGEHTPHSEQKTGLYLDEQMFLSMEEIRHFKCPGTGRRLLVLNVCSGATARMTGGLARIGLAHELVGPNQSVIAHIWPAYSETALSFGALLAVFLGAQDNFSAFAAASAQLRDPEGIVAALDGVLGNRLRAYDRINASIPALKNVLSWGCPVFLT